MGQTVLPGHRDTASRFAVLLALSCCQWRWWLVDWGKWVEGWLPGRNWDTAYFSAQGYLHMCDLYWNEGN